MGLDYSVRIDVVIARCTAENALLAGRTDESRSRVDQHAIALPKHTPLGAGNASVILRRRPFLARAFPVRLLAGCHRRRLPQ